MTAEDLVRSLDDWRPAPGAGSPATSVLAREARNIVISPVWSTDKRSVFGGAPAERGVGGGGGVGSHGDPGGGWSRGGSPQAPYAYGPVIEPVTRLNPRAAPTGRDERASAVFDTSALNHSSSRGHPQLHAGGVEGRGGGAPVILSTRRSASAMSGSARAMLRVQDAVGARLDLISGGEGAGGLTARLFRECRPDLTGLIAAGEFEAAVARRFGLSREDAALLRARADPTGLGAVSLPGVRRALLERVDEEGGELAPPPPPRVRAAITATSERLVDVFPAPVAPLSGTAMSPRERAEYCDRGAIIGVLGSRDRAVRDAWRAVDCTPDGEFVRTRLTYEEASDVLREFRVDISPDRLAELYCSSSGGGGRDDASHGGSARGGGALSVGSVRSTGGASTAALLLAATAETHTGTPDGITLSELSAGASAFFADRWSSGPSHADPARSVREIGGAYVGARRGGGGPAAKPSVSAVDFLHHHDVPGGRGGEGGSDASPRSALRGDEGATASAAGFGGRWNKHAVEGGGHARASTKRHVAPSRVDYGIFGGSPIAAGGEYGSSSMGSATPPAQSLGGPNRSPLV